MPARRSVRRGDWQLYSCIALAVGVIGGSFLLPWPAFQWVSLALIPLSAWCGVDWVRTAARTREQQSIRARLSRLPDDFYLLHDLVIPAPWGKSPVDQVVVSRFGVVVIGTGVSAGRMVEQVEAVRSLLFMYGVTKPSVPVRPLILLPPGAPAPKRLQYGIPTLRVEHLRLDHLAPSAQPVLTEEQVETVAQCILQARAAG
ncbi:MAG TPA: hypothetical protein VD969_15220 [Symbiobacteriaceae bacterium]|nr:hypothetical protein [Symbiobacteriaceae bacterium]